MSFNILHPLFRVAQIKNAYLLFILYYLLYLRCVVSDWPGKKRMNMDEIRRLVRPRTGRMIAGVCKGFADYFGVDVTLIRVIYALIACCSAFFGAAIAYLIMVILIPQGE